MPKHLVIFSIGTALLICTCCILTYSLLFGLFLPGSQCKLTDYPKGHLLIGKGVGGIFRPSYTILTEDSLDSVLTFYDRSLPVQPHRNDIIETKVWSREILTGSRYLYSCFAEDLTGNVIETQCIYVSKNNEHTEIETLSFTAEFYQRCPEKRVD